MPYAIRGGLLILSPAGAYKTWTEANIARKHLRAMQTKHGRHNQQSHGRSRAGVGYLSDQQQAQRRQQFGLLTQHANIRDSYGKKMEEMRTSLGEVVRPKLSAGQREALETYATPAHKDINGALRAKKSHALTRDLDSAIEQAEIPQSAIVYRGVSKTFGQKLTEGATFRDHGYTSTTTRSATAEAFSNNGVVMVLHVPKGHPMMPMTQAFGSNEREFLLPRGSLYHVEQVVHGVKGEHGVPYTYARVSIVGG